MGAPPSAVTRRGPAPRRLTPVDERNTQEMGGGRASSGRTPLPPPPGIGLVLENVTISHLPPSPCPGVRGGKNDLHVYL